MKSFFGNLPNGKSAWLYTISCGSLTAKITDLGATLVQLWVPDRNGVASDVVLGYDNAEGYWNGGSFLGTTVGRNANRLKGASFSIEEKKYQMAPNENGNNLHSGPDFFYRRLWDAENVSKDSITFCLHSPSGDQGFPGNALIRVTYHLDGHGLHIIYDADSDQDTVFNLTNHSYFNLAGHNQPDKALTQLLTLPARIFTPDDAQNIPTGELRAVAGTPMDFRKPKPIQTDIEENYAPLALQGGYDHNFEVFCNPCAILEDTQSGRSLAVYTDCPGIQLYSGNYLKENGKDGIFYGKRTGIALETQFYPDCLHHPMWKQPIVKAGTHYHSETEYRFSITEYAYRLSSALPALLR